MQQVRHRDPAAVGPGSAHTRLFRLATLWLTAAMVAGGAGTVHGQTGSTAPALRYGFIPGGGATVTTGQPIVIDLNQDGAPEIVFVTMAGFASRRLIAIHGATGTVAFNVNAFQPSLSPPIVIGDPYSELAAGDLDGDGRPEIVAVDAHDGTGPDPFRRSLLAFRPDGSLLWTSEDVVSDPLIDSTSGFLRPAIADLDGDGTPEIIVGYAGRGPATPASVASEDYVTVFDALGHIRWTARGGGTTQGGSPTSNAAVVADIDLDGSPEILFSDDVFSHDGTLERSVGDVNLRVASVGVASLDDDPFAEILFRDVFGRLHLYDHDGTRKWGPVTAPGTGSYGGGVPPIGDVTGDGLPEIIVVRDQSIEVMARGGGHLFSVPLPEIGYGGNATIFDLNGDGLAEIVYQSARGPFDTATVRGSLYVIDGATRALNGGILAPRNGSDSERGPLVADVNGDGTAEIVTTGWNESTLLRVFTAASGTWSQTRPVWNQYTFHATNVRSTGVIPAREPINWLTPGLNSFGANGFPETAPTPSPSSVNDAYGTTSGSGLTVAAPGVLGNDNPNGGNALRAALVTPPAHGALTLSASGSFGYTPNPGFAGIDSFTYRAANQSGPSNLATVSITVADASTPVPPTNFRLMSVAGNAVTMAWTPPSSGAPPTGYQLEGGLAPGQVLGALPLGNSSPVTLSLPTGILYLRVRTLAGAAVSIASNEIQVYVNVPAAPAAPGNLLGLVVGDSLSLAWTNNPAGGTPSSMLLDVSGAFSGSLPIAPGEAFSFTGVPPGTYTLAVRAANANGVSGPSNAVTLTFPTVCSGAPLPPAGFVASRSGNVVSLAWNTAVSGPAPTGYALNVTGSFVGTVPTTTRGLSAAVGAGTYTIQVVAVNACGPSAPTAPQTVTVP